MRIFSEKGFSSIAAAGMMVLLSLFGFSIASLITTSREINLDQVSYDRAFYLTQAGLEYAMRKIYEGFSPVVAPPGIVFGSGSFSIARSGRIVTVTGLDASSQVVHSVTSPSQADCTDFDLSHADLESDGTKLNHISFRKICLEQTVLDKMNVSWTNAGSEGLRKVRVGNQTLYDEPSVASGEQVELADYIMNGINNNNFNEIRFTHDMEGKTFTVTFIMGDGSRESHTFTPED